MEIRKIALQWEKPFDDVKKKVMNVADDFAAKSGVKGKDGMHLCLAAEEMIEMFRLIADRRPNEMLLEKEEGRVSLRLVTRMPEQQPPSGEACRDTEGVAGKLRMLYASTYADLERDDTAAKEIGLRKAEREDLEEMGIRRETGAYVWTLESYNLAAYDKIMEDDEEEWQEISRSILANLAEDIRVFIFPEETQLYLGLLLKGQTKTSGGEYAISPEFDRLKKIPVAKTRFQVRLVQLMFGGLAKKQESNDDVKIAELRFKCSYSRKGELTVLRYTPRACENTKRAVVFFHGGADLFPALPYHYRLAEKIAVGAKARVFLLMYDLAPKVNPPVQILEGLDIYRQLLADPGLDLDPSLTAIMGDSSGGTMTAAVALLARDGQVPAPAGQLLLYPSLDMRYNTPSMKKYRDVPVVNGDAIDCYRKIVHSDRSEGNKYYMSPAEAADCSGLCPAYIEPAEYDALHDEAVEYAKRLEKDGVHVVLNETKGTVHSFDMASSSSIVEEAVKSRLAFLEEIFA